MTDEKDLVEVTIRVDVSGGIQLAHTCARCGAVAQSIPTSYDCANPRTGRTDTKVFVVQSAMPPEGWEHLRMSDPEKTWHLEVCPECIRAFFDGLVSMPMETVEETRRFAESTYRWIASKGHCLDPDGLSGEMIQRLFEAFRGYIRHGQAVHAASVEKILSRVKP